MKNINIFKNTGNFAEDKDLAKEIRLKKIMPSLKYDDEVVIDFAGVESTTQSFIHALLSEVIREFGSEVLDRIAFKNCNANVRGIITIVVDYMQI